VLILYFNAISFTIKDIYMKSTEELMFDALSGIIDIDSIKDVIWDKLPTNGEGLLVGAVFGIHDYKSGKTETRSIGSRDMAGKKPIQSGNVMRIRSVSKTYIVEVIKQLHKEGALDINDKVWDWIQRLKQCETLDVQLRKALERLHIGQDSTIEDLMKHTSGVGTWGHAGMYSKLTETPGKKWSLKELFNEEQGWVECGTYKYSEIGYNLLGLIAPLAIGQLECEDSYKQVIRERVIDKYGLKKTFSREEAEKPLS